VFYVNTRKINVKVTQVLDFHVRDSFHIYLHVYLNRLPLLKQHRSRYETT